MEDMETDQNGSDIDMEDAIKQAVCKIGEFIIFIDKIVDLC